MRDEHVGRGDGWLRGRLRLRSAPRMQQPVVPLGNSGGSHGLCGRASVLQAESVEQLVRRAQPVCLKRLKGSICMAVQRCKEIHCVQLKRR